MESNLFKFAIDVKSGALACPDATAFYTKALIKQTDINHFNAIPGVKDSGRIPMLNSGKLLKSFNCGWSDVTVDLDGKLIKVDRLSMMVEVCQEDIEKSMFGQAMAIGSNNSMVNNPIEFSKALWDYLGGKVNEEIEELRWLGDKTSANTFLKLTDGYLARVNANTASLASKIDSITGGVTPANVIAELTKIVSAIPVAVDETEIKLFVSRNIWLAYLVASNLLNAQAGITGNLGNGFLGNYTIVPVSFLPANTAIATRQADIAYAFDNEPEQMVVVDMYESNAVPTVRYRVNLKVGFDFATYANTVLYSPVAG